MDEQNAIPLAERLESGATIRNVYGKPIERNGRTIIPVARIRYEYGTAGSASDSQQNEEGAGGGLNAAPVCVLEVIDEETRLIPINDFKKTALFFLAGLMFGLLFFRRG